MDTIRKAIADQFAGQACYLDGAPAKIMGRLERFAIVATLDPSGPRVEYDWHTVNLVMRRDRYFSAA